MTCSNYIIAMAQQRAGAQIHLVAGIVGAYRAAADNVRLARKKRLAAVVERNTAIFNECQSALERIGHGEFIKRETLCL